MHKIFILVIALCMLLTFSIYTKTADVNVKLPILLYHNVVENIEDKNPDLHIEKNNFESHLIVLKNNGYNPITFEEYYNYRINGNALPKNPILITFDDGYLSNYELAYPLLKKYNMKATFFIVTNSASNTEFLAYPHFNWNQALEMQNSGLISIESHSFSHKIHSQISNEEIIYEACKSFNDIVSNLDKLPFVYAYPSGIFTDESQRIVSETYYKIQVTVIGGINDNTVPLNQLKRFNISNNINENDLLELIKEE